MKKLFSVIFTVVLIFIYGFIFVSAQNIAGDVDADGFVKAADARIVLRVAVGLETLNAEMLDVADVDNNGAVNSADARLILRAAVGLEVLHTHTYSTEIIIKEADCTESGQKRYVCDCFAYKEEVISAKGHQFTDLLVLPTCTQKGYTKHICSDCSYSFTDDYVNSVGHEYRNIVTEPGCTNKGYTTKACVNCSHKTVEDYVDAKGHTYKSIVTEPTCTAKGYTTKICTVCSEKTTGDYVDAKGHTYKSIVTAPTCTAKGYTTKICTACSEETTGDYVDAKGHTYKSTVTAPTCIKKGYTTKICVDCDYKLTMDYINAKGHSYRSVVTAPTCIEKGYTSYKCSACNDVFISDYVKAKGHTYQSVATAPTCINKGYTTKICSDCLYEIIADYVPAKGHSYATTEILPSCTQNGERLYSCVCGDSYSEDIPATGHSFDGAACSVCAELNPDYVPPIEYSNVKGKITFEESGDILDDRGAKLLLIPVNSTVKNYDNSQAASFITGDYESGIKVRGCNNSGSYDFSSEVPVGTYLLVAVSSNSNSSFRLTDEEEWNCYVDNLLNEYFSQIEISYFKTLCSYFRIAAREIEVLADSECITNIVFEETDF